MTAPTPREVRHKYDHDGEHQWWLCVPPHPYCTCTPPDGVTRNHANGCALFDVDAAFRQALTRREPLDVDAAHKLASQSKAYHNGSNHLPDYGPWEECPHPWCMKDRAEYARLEAADGD